MHKENRGPALWSGIKWALLALLLGSATTAVVLMVRAGDVKKVQTAKKAATKEQQAHVDKPLVIERKAGKMIWRLKAQKAEQESGGSMHLYSPQLELFTDKGARVPITGSEAWFNPLKKAIHFKGDVVAHYGEWTLYADDVTYDQATDTMHVPGDFRIESALTRTRGQGLTVWRDEQRLHVEHAVWIKDKHPDAIQGMP